MKKDISFKISQIPTHLDIIKKNYLNKKLTKNSFKIYALIILKELFGLMNTQLEELSVGTGLSDTTTLPSPVICNKK